MNKPNITPGPWTHTCYAYFVTASDKFEVAACHAPNSPTGEQLTIAAANTKAIAALPELLEALGAVHTAYKSGRRDELAYAANELARFALEKAGYTF